MNNQEKQLYEKTKREKTEEINKSSFQKRKKDIINKANKDAIFEKLTFIQKCKIYYNDLKDLLKK